MKRRISFPYGVLILFLGLSAAVAQAPDPDEHPRLRQLRENKLTFEELIADSTNATEQVELQRQLDLVIQEIANTRKRLELQEQEKSLEEEQEKISRYALREALRAIEVDMEATSNTVVGLNKKIRSLKLERASMEKNRNDLDPGGVEFEDQVAELEQQIRNTDEEVLALALRRDTQELSLHVAAEAKRIEEVIRSLPINPDPTIRMILDKRRYIRGEVKRQEDMGALLDDLSKQREEIGSERELLVEKFGNIDAEITLLKEKSIVSRNARQIRRMISESRATKKSIGERIDIVKEQLVAINDSSALANQLQGLYERETAYLNEELRQVMERYGKSVLIPIAAVAIILVFYYFLSRFLFPRIYERDALFTARRLGGYITVFLVGLVLAIFFLEDLKAIATVIGILGAAIVIALQDLCSSFAGWFVIIASRKLSVGDRVEIDGQRGDVIDIQLLRVTILELNNWLGVDEPTGRIVVIPNSFIFKSNVVNYSHVHPYIWGRVDILVTFETPAQEAKEVLWKALEEETAEQFEQARNAAVDMEDRYGVPDTVYRPKMYSIIADSGVQFSLIFVCHYRKFMGTRNKLNDRIIREFDENGKLEFAYPTERHIPTPIIPEKGFRLDGGRE